ncbi:MAG: Fic family protein [Bacillales bacterium]|jgi:Fic family protein|nr:Fic family protein [Bacillales bacterium]
MAYKDILQNWQDLRIQTETDLDKKLHDFSILFAYNSGKMKNKEFQLVDTKGIFENGKVHSFSGDVRTLFEQQNQKDCYSILKSKIIEKEPLSIDLMKLIHFELTKGTYDERPFLDNRRASEFKIYDYIVCRNEVGSVADNVGDELTELLNDVHVYCKKDVLKVAVYLHLVFLQIHPFTDGNGRVGRMLMNYFLMINDHPPIIIYEEDQLEFYKALECFDINEDIDPMVEFLKKECVKTWFEYEFSTI